MCLFPGQLVGERNEPIRHGSIGYSQRETGSLVVRACGSCLQYAEVTLNVVLTWRNGYLLLLVN